jgi:hypothetical protein
MVSRTVSGPPSAQSPGSAPDASPWRALAVDVRRTADPPGTAMTVALRYEGAAPLAAVDVQAGTGDGAPCRLRWTTTAASLATRPTLAPGDCLILSLAWDGEGPATGRLTISAAAGPRGRRRWTYLLPPPIDALPGPHPARALLPLADDAASAFGGPDADAHPRRRAGRPVRPAVVAALLGAGLVLAAALAAAALAWRTGRDGSPSPDTPTATRWLARDLSARCPPEPGQPACDALRAGLWAGDPASWRQWAAQRGEAPPAEGEVLQRTIDLRLSAGDAAARIDAARAARLPAPLIAAVRVEETGGRPRVTAVEIVNFGTVPAPLGGAEVAGLGRIAPGVMLAPGARCALGRDAGPAACPTVAAPAAGVEVAPGGRIVLAGPDGQELDVFPVP